MTEGNSWVEASSGVARLARFASLRGWTPATSGNFSAVVSFEPLVLAITPSGAEKGSLGPDQILRVEEGVPTQGRPSAETALHMAVARAARPAFIAHTHSVWSTLVSSKTAGGEGVSLQGYELLKGLSGVQSHDHEEWIPIVGNSQNWNLDSHSVKTLLTQGPRLHAFLIRGHGLYTWGASAPEVERHLEALEFLLEVVGRQSNI